MKKVISMLLALAVITTSMVCFTTMHLSAQSSNGLPESMNDLKGSLTIDTFDKYTKNFKNVQKNNFYDSAIQLKSADDCYYNNSETSVYYWRDNGYVGALQTADQTGYFTGIDEKDLSTITMTTDYLTSANGIFDIKLAANTNSFFTVESGTDNGGSGVLALRPKVNGTPSTCLSYYVDSFEDSEVDYNTVIYQNGKTTPLAYSSNGKTRKYGLVRDYFGTGKHAVVFKDTDCECNSTDSAMSPTQHFNDGKTYYYFTYPARDVGDTVQIYPNLDAAGLKYMQIGGLNATVAYTAIKSDDNWKISSIKFTIDDDLLDLNGYNGFKNTAKLYFIDGSNRMTAESGRHTITYNVSIDIGDTLNLRLPSFISKLNSDSNNTSNFGNIYMKQTTVDYTLDPNSYLSAYEEKYQAMVDAGVTAENVSDYESYVPAVKDEYNKLNDFLKGYINSEYISNIEAIDYSYYVGNKADEFEAAYDLIKDYDANNMSLQEIEAILQQIVSCRTQYNLLNADVKAFIPTEKLNHLISLEKAYDNLIQVKESGTYFADFSDDSGVNSAIYTSYLNKLQSDGQKAAIYGNVNQSSGTSNWICGFVDGATKDNDYASPDGVAKVKNGNVSQVISRTTSGMATNSEHAKNSQRSILMAVKPQYLPNDINKLSFTADVSEFADSNTDYKEFVIMYGKNENFTYSTTNINASYVEGLEDNTDEPIFGTSVKVYPDGSVKFGTAYYCCENSAYDGRLLNHIITTYADESENIASSGGGGVPSSSVSKPGDFLNKKIDLSCGKFNLEIEFNQHTITPDANALAAGTYKKTTMYVPTFTMVDGKGNRLIGTQPIYNGTTFDTNPARIKNANVYATDIYGVAFGSYTSNATATTQTLAIDDLYVQGNGANAVTGATIKKSNKADEQDLRFILTLSENNTLKDEGYNVTGYGCILAVEGAFQAANLDELTIETAAELGTSKAKVYVREAQNGSVPSTLFAELGKSAAVEQGVGLQYRLRAFVKYEKDGSVKYIYSQNRAEGMMSNGQHVRSVYSTARNIASYLKNDTSCTYTSFDMDDADNSEEFKAAIANIVDNGAKSTLTSTIGGNDVLNSSVLLKFVTENIDLLG